jgi:hypothetical protein
MPAAVHARKDFSAINQVEEPATCIACVLVSNAFTVEGLFLSTIFEDATHDTYMISFQEPGSN